MNTLGLFVKHPQLGQVKTRLAERLGPEVAKELYAAFVSDLVERFGGVAKRRVLGYSPATNDSRDYFQGLAKSRYQLWPQPEGDLGERIVSFFCDQLRDPTDRVVLIGSDSPTLPHEFVERAFAMLGAADVVLGPATDGGYYLVGFRGRCWPIFDGVTWSTATVLSQTIDRVRLAGASLALLPPWYDVDTEADLHLLRGHIAGLIHAGTAGDLAATTRVLGLDRESPSSGL